MNSLFDPMDGDAVATEDDLFGSVLPAGYVPLGRDPSRLAGDVKQLEEWASRPEAPAAKKFDYREHYNRAYKLLNDLHPGKYWKLDYQEIVYTSFGRKGPDLSSARVIAKDMLGFADVGGVEKPNGRMVCANITTVKAIGEHLRKYTDDKATHGPAKIPIENHLREFLDCGGLFYVLGYHKPGRFWEAKIVAVTPALLDEYKARKRGRKA